MDIFVYQPYVQSKKTIQFIRKFKITRLLQDVPRNMTVARRLGLDLLTLFFYF